MAADLTSHRSERRPLEVLTLGMGGEIFALEMVVVHEVLDVVAITAVPNARRFVKGLINVRGKIVPVVDLKSKFGMGAASQSGDTRFVVLDVAVKGERLPVAILADRVYEVTELAAASLEETPRLGMRWRPEFIQAVGKRQDGFVIVLDIDRVFASEESPLIGGGKTEAANKDELPDHGRQK